MVYLVPGSWPPEQCQAGFQSVGGWLPPQALRRCGTIESFRQVTVVDYRRVGVHLSPPAACRALLYQAHWSRGAKAPRRHQLDFSVLGEVFRAVLSSRVSPSDHRLWRTASNLDSSPEVFGGFHGPSLANLLIRGDPFQIPEVSLGGGKKISRGFVSIIWGLHLHFVQLCIYFKKKKSVLLKVLFLFLFFEKFAFTFPLQWCLLARL